MAYAATADGWPAAEHVATSAGGHSVSLLGGFELTRDGMSVSLPLSAQRVVAFIALRERRTLRIHTAAMLWPDTSEQRASGCLRSALWRLGRNGPSPIRASSGHLVLADRVDVDLRRSVALCRRLMNTTVEPAGHAPDDLLLSGDLLPDWYDDWVVFERERFRQLRLHALEALAARLTATERYGEAVEAALIAVQDEPLRESAHRALVAAHFAEGNRCEAIRQFRRFCEILQKELGVEPSETFRALIRSGLGQL